MNTFKLIFKVHCDKQKKFYMRKLLKQVFHYLDLADAINLATVCWATYDTYHSLNFEYVDARIQNLSKMQRLNAFIKYFAYLPDQGTEQWLRSRIHTIGGSEMSTILGQNKYQGLKDLVGTKLGVPSYRFNGNIATRWGKLFEDVIRQYTEFMLDCKISETGSIPGYQNEDGIVLQSYSPDGLGLAYIAKIKNMIDRSSTTYLGTKASDNPEFKSICKSALRKFRTSKNKENKMLLTLFEFKCPYRAMPHGDVPEHYISQPKTGLCTISMMEFGLFMQGIFRKCSIKEFEVNNLYDKDLHTSYRPVTYGDPITAGFIGVYDMSAKFKEEDPLTRILSILIDNDPYAPTDEEPEMFNDILDGDDSTYSSSGSEEDSDSDSDIEVDNTVTDSNCVISEVKQGEIVEQLCDLAYNEIKMFKSDFYNIKLDKDYISTAMILGKLVSQMGEDFALPNDMKRSLAWKAFIRIVKTKTSGQLRFLKSMFNDILNNAFNMCKTYDLNDLNFGIDFGNSKDKINAKQFEKIVEKIVDDMKDGGGLSLYYPEGMFHQVEDSKYFDAENNHANYVDRSLPLRTSNRLSQPQKWLFQNVQEFEEFCKKRDVMPIGIIPWKMFMVSCVPVYKDPKYVDDRIDKIQTAHRAISEIRDNHTPSEYEDALEKMFPSRRSNNSYTRPVTSYADNTMSDFMDL